MRDELLVFLSLAPLFRGVIYESRISQLFQQFHYGEEPPTVKTVETDG